jgi:MoxR-like ATPase
MTLDELRTAIKKRAAKDKKLMWQKSGYSISPFISRFATVDEHKYNAVFYSVYSLVANPEIHYVTILCFYEGNYVLKCGDPYLEGSISETMVEKLIKNALDRVNENSRKKLPELFRRSFNATPRSSVCGFNQKNYEAAGEMEACEHIANFLGDLPQDVFEKLNEDYYQGLFDADAANQLSADLQTKFDRYAFKKHLLLEGDKGSGKTYAATMWGKDKDVSRLFIGGHEQFESIDFLGHYVQQKDALLIWKDGPLSEAFRRARAGEKTVLIIDEILRIPKRELNILISALSPIEENYVLRTGRAMSAKDDIAVEEVLLAPTKNLWVIGTTNLGSNYAVESMDEALIDRFKPVRKDTTPDELRRILTQTANKRKIALECVNKLMDFYAKMSRLQATKIINKLVNIRQLNEALELARNKNEIREILVDSRLLWVDRDANGYPDKEQLVAIDAVMRKVYE